jgi:hypothetical protein
VSRYLARDRAAIAAAAAACGRFMLTPKPGSRPSLQARLVAGTPLPSAG